MVYPLYTLFQRRLRNSSWTAFLTCLVVFLVVLIPTGFLVKTLIQESAVLFVLAKQKLAIGVFQNCYNEFCESIKTLSRDPIVSAKVQEVVKSITSWVSNQGSTFLFRVPVLVTQALIVLFTMFYTLKDGKRVFEQANAYLHIHTKTYHQITQRLQQIIHGVVYGYLLIALIQGALGGLGFLLFGISSPIFWGLVMMVLSLIPYVGTGVIWVPASLFLFLEGMFQDSTALMFKGAGLFFYGLVIVSSIDNFLRPKFIGKAAKIHPLVILVGTVGGIFSLGAAGVIIGPLVLSLLQVVAEVYTKRAK